MLKIDLQPGESLIIGDKIQVYLESKSGNRARLAVDAPREMKINKKLTADPSSYAAKYGLSGEKRVNLNVD